MALEQKYFTEGKNDNLKLVKRMTRSRIRNMYSTVNKRTWDGT